MRESCSRAKKEARSGLNRYRPRITAISAVITAEGSFFTTRQHLSADTAGCHQYTSCLFRRGLSCYPWYQGRSRSCQRRSEARPSHVLVSACFMPKSEHVITAGYDDKFFVSAIWWLRFLIVQKANWICIWHEWVVFRMRKNEFTLSYYG